MAWGLASSSPCDTRFDFLGSCIGGFRISGGHCGWAKSLKFSVVGKSISKTNFEAKIFNFSSPAPRCTLTDRGHGGFAFFAHRHCPATQGSTFSARSARRVREKSTRSWPQISNRAKGSGFCTSPLPNNAGCGFFGSERAKVAPSEGGYGCPLIECCENDRPEFDGTDQVERGPRFEAPFQKCVIGYA